MCMTAALYIKPPRSERVCRLTVLSLYFYFIVDLLICVKQIHLIRYEW